MDSQLLEGVLERTPEINPRIANGLATEQLLGLSSLSTRSSAVRRWISQTA